MACLQEATLWVAGLLITLTSDGSGQSGDARGGVKPAQAATRAEAKTASAAPTDSTAESKSASPDVSPAVAGGPRWQLISELRCISRGRSQLLNAARKIPPDPHSSGGRFPTGFRPV